MSDGAWSHPAAWDEEDLLRECRVGRGRSGGPGGQHRNKVETEVMITHEPSGISAKAGERREPSVNRRVAIRRLRLALATELRAGVPVGEIGSALWKSRLERRRDREGATVTRISVNPEHRDYPALLAEAMDTLAAAGWEPRKAGIRLGVSASQVVRLIGAHRPALAAMNRERTRRSLRPLS